MTKTAATSVAAGIQQKICLVGYALFVEELWRQEYGSKDSGSRRRPYLR